MKNRILMALFLLAAMFLLAGCRTETIVYGDNLETAETAVIFYPGGRVDPGAYGQLLQMISDRGIPVIVARMPLNLAILHGSAASDIVKEHPEVDHWILAGHSLGGYMASGWVAKHKGGADGLILLAAYPTREIDVPVLSIYGSADGVLNRDKYEKGMKMIPALEEHVIEGGNHCQFGDYGFQKGDGEASISRTQQMETAASLMLSFIKAVTE